jgi:hypothetical protein
MKLTDRSIAAPIPAGKADHIVFDSRVPGFGLRSRGDARTWIFQYKITGHTRRMVIGKATAIKAEKALAVARGLYQRVMDGGDPKNERELRRAEAANTLGPLIDRYLETKKGELRPRSLAEVQRHLEDHAKPLHKLPVNSITQAVVADRLNDVAKDSGVVAANRMRSSLSARLGDAARLCRSQPGSWHADAEGKIQRSRAQRCRIKGHLERPRCRSIWRDHQAAHADRPAG